MAIGEQSAPARMKTVNYCVCVSRVLVESEYLVQTLISNQCTSDIIHRWTIYVLDTSITLKDVFRRSYSVSTCILHLEKSLL